MGQTSSLYIILEESSISEVYSNIVPQIQKDLDSIPYVNQHISKFVRDEDFYMTNLNFPTGFVCLFA